MTAIEALNQELDRLHNSGTAYVGSSREVPQWAQARIEDIIKALCEIASTQQVVHETTNWRSDDGDEP